MDALGNVFIGEVLILHGHENDDCQELDDRHSDRSRGGSELLPSAYDFQSEHSRVSSELHRYFCKSSNKSKVGRRTTWTSGDKTRVQPGPKSITRCVELRCLPQIQQIISREKSGSVPTGETGTKI